MSLFIDKMRLLAIGVTVCLGLTSCHPPGRQAASEGLPTGISEGRVDRGRVELSREQIIEAANDAAWMYGWDLNESLVTYDEGNAQWKSMWSDIELLLSSIPASDPRRAELPPVSELMPKFEGHDYQVVLYMHRVPRPGAVLWVIVDRHTGEVLKVLLAG